MNTELSDLMSLIVGLFMKKSIVEFAKYPFSERS